MESKELSNMEIVNAMKFMQGDIQDKKLPIKLSYAIRRSMPDLQQAYNTYADALTKLCEDYGCDANDMSVDDPEKRKEFNKEIADLLSEKTEVKIHTVDYATIDACGKGSYDPLTYKEVDGLWWLIDEGE